MAVPESRCRHLVLSGPNMCVQYDLSILWDPFEFCAGFGVEALKQVIPEVVNMILPTNDSTSQQVVHVPHTRQSKPPSSLLGPAFVMRVLANNGEQTAVS